IADWGVAGGYFLEDGIDVDGFETTLWARNYKLGLLKVQLAQGASTAHDFEMVDIYLYIGPVRLMMRLVCSGGPTAPKNVVKLTVKGAYDWFKRLARKAIFRLPEKYHDHLYNSVQYSDWVCYGPLEVKLIENIVILHEEVVVTLKAGAISFGLRMVSGEDAIGESGIFIKIVRNGKLIHLGA
ncbi:MAG: hypothetical protein AAF902_01125, partial [Chloroflexota bacterium]